MIKVAVTGAMGRMGKEVVKAVLGDLETDLTAAIDKFGEGQEITENIKIETDIKKALETKKADVVVDFTQPSVIFENAKTYIKLGIKSVIGTTGLNDEQVKELEKLSVEHKVGCIIAPNFALGAVLMMMFAKTASKYFNNAEIIELHHNQKKDAPSGTAIKTAKMMAEVNSDFQTGNIDDVELEKGARGASYPSNLNIHSIRIPGFVASQEVIFGSNGQILTIRHDTTNRECFMSGVLLAVKHVYKNNDFVFGLENIL
ncbi:MAG: 4-hydroxy-tetrahydrodipicolinate reductase [Candidatus Gastranaerophilales bacterium]|nr:4-hydroxy-tetrahydrodipicolinate reductase [Candidatus Gastranaerophilales bacterium]